MKGDKELIKGTIWNTLGSTMYGVNSFLMLAVASRIGTVEEAGYFGIAFTTAQLMYIAGLLGMNHYQQTDYQEKYAFAVYARAKVMACGIAATGCACTIALLQFSGMKAVYTIVLTFLMMLNAVGELFQSLFFQKNRLDLSGSALFHRTLWSLVAFGAIAFATRNILSALAVQVAVNLALTLYYAVRYTPKFVNAGAGKNQGYRTSVQLIVECFPLFISVLLMNVIINASKYGIEILMDDTAQGYYNMIFMPAQVINLCSQFLFKPLLNKYSAAFVDNRLSDVRAMMGRQLSVVFGFTIICCIAAYFFGPQVLGYIYDKDLAAQRIALTLVVLGGGIFAVGQLFFYILVILRLQNKIMYIYIVGLLAAVILTRVFVLFSGIIGAVLSFILTQAVVVLGYYIILVKSFKGKLTNEGI